MRDADLEKQLGQMSEAYHALKAMTAEAHAAAKDLRAEIKAAKSLVPEVMDAATERAAQLLAGDVRAVLDARLEKEIDELARELRKRLAL